MTAVYLTGSLFPLVTTQVKGFYRPDSIKPFSVTAGGKGFGSIFSPTDSIEPFSVPSAGKKLFSTLNDGEYEFEFDAGKTLVTPNYEDGVFGFVFAGRNDAVEFYESKIACLQKICKSQPEIEALYTHMKKSGSPENDLQSMARRRTHISQASLHIKAYKKHLLDAKATAAVIEYIAAMDVPASVKLMLAVKELSVAEKQQKRRLSEEMGKLSEV